MVKKIIKTKHGDIKLPAFLPDATYGSIKSISFQDAENAGIRELVTTTLHIEQKIGSQFIKNYGGIHKFFGWQHPILTDSGGWQVFSLINSKRKLKSGNHTKNKITELGCSFINQDTGEQSLLTPESSIVIQANLGSDIMTVLDNPILGNASFAERKNCVRINTIWAKRAKKEFSKRYPIILDSSPSASHRLLGSVIQGGNDFELRKQSAEELLELDFDIYNFGGMPMHTPITWLAESQSGFFHEMLHYVSELIPAGKLKYAMGVGQPEDIAYCADIGWQLFDTVLPTRNARHGYLYVSEGEGDQSRNYKDMNYDIMHIKTERYQNDDSPVDKTCNCEACKTVSRAYLRHLLKIRESSGYRLATIHNLRFYADWMEKIRSRIEN